MRATVTTGPSETWQGTRTMAAVSRGADIFALVQIKPAYEFTAWTWLALHLHQLVHRHHLDIENGHDQQRAEHDQADHEDAERQGQEVVGAVGAAADVEEEHHVHAHLG